MQRRQQAVEHRVSLRPVVSSSPGLPCYFRRPMTGRLTRLIPWIVALALGLVVTIWLGRVTGWLGGERLVDVFTGSGFGRYARVVAIAPVWALFTALFVSLFLKAGRVLARRRAAARTD